jgi:hypothetical protein
MRRIRNPRYAPEFLELKLSPSGMLINPPPAELGAVYPAPPPMQNTSEPGDPPPVDPTPPPADPSGPAYYDYAMA